MGRSKRENGKEGSLRKVKNTMKMRRVETSRMKVTT